MYQPGKSEAMKQGLDTAYAANYVKLADTVWSRSKVNTMRTDNTSDLKLIKYSESILKRKIARESGFEHVCRVTQAMRTEPTSAAAGPKPLPTQGLCRVRIIGLNLSASKVSMWWDVWFEHTVLYSYSNSRS